MTYDIDYAHIVHNAVYIRWLEDLRTALISDVYPIQELLADGISPIRELMTKLRGSRIVMILSNHAPIGGPVGNLQVPQV